MSLFIEIEGGSVGLGFLDHGFEAFDIFLVTVDGEADAGVFLLGEVTVLVAFLDDFEALFHIAELIRQEFFVLQGKAVDSPKLFLYVLGVSWLAGVRFQLPCHMTDDVEGVLGAVDHVEDFHF